jgi:RNA polymerase sigma-70 factor, ECF subfamily
MGAAIGQPGDCGGLDGPTIMSVTTAFSLVPIVRSKVFRDGNLIDFRGLNRTRHQPSVLHLFQLAREKEAVVSSKALQKQLVTFLPHLRAFAISLCHDANLADDLVQETLLKAWGHLDTFREGSNLKAWLYAILRNSFLTHLRRRREEVPLDIEGNDIVSLRAAPEQYGRLASKDLLKALAQLPPDQREAVILIGAEGFSYEEAAKICGCPIGTVKSRVNRARVRLLDLLDASAPNGPEQGNPQLNARRTLNPPRPGRHSGTLADRGAIWAAT